MLEQTVKNILSAKVYPVAHQTPLSFARQLSQQLGQHIYIKREDTQPIYSFKLRGAYNCVANLSSQQQSAGVITASAGNHGQGVALAAQQLGLQGIIVMPVTTPEIKVKAVEQLGAKVELHGDHFDQAAQLAMQWAKEQGLSYIPPYDDPFVIAGQGTIGMELLKQTDQPIDIVFVPVGGGGLIAGVASYIKYLSPNTKVVAVESAESACLQAAFAAQQPVALPSVGLFAEGVAVKKIGEHCWPLCQAYVDEVITVSTDELCAAVKDMFDDTRAMCEPSGALGLAGLKQYARRQPQVKDQCWVTIASGANVNFDRLRYISEVAEVGEGREALFAVQIPEQPDAFRNFCARLAGRSITEFNYRRQCRPQDQQPDEAAHIFVGLKLSGRDGVPPLQERQQLLQSWQEQGVDADDLTDNEVAKYHVRHMVGGGPVLDERIIRLQFPERAGALLHFLTGLGPQWDISMFHYRNHGAAFARVLVGIRCTNNQWPQLQQHIQGIGYDYWDETNNLAYQRFLSGNNAC